MGACFSFTRSKPEAGLKAIRVVHLDGSLEEYDPPVTVDQVVSNFPKQYFLCTPIQLLQDGLVPLSLDHQLRSGQIYFMLPNSTLKFDASPMDLTSLTRKLTNIAKTGKCPCKSVPTSPSASPNRFLERGDGVEYLGSSHKSPQWKPILASITEG